MGIELKNRYHYQGLLVTHSQIKKILVTWIMFKKERNSKHLSKRYDNGLGERERSE